MPFDFIDRRHKVFSDDFKAKLSNFELALQIVSNNESSSSLSQFKKITLEEVGKEILHQILGGLTIRELFIDIAKIPEYLSNKLMIWTDENQNSIQSKKHEFIKAERDLLCKLMRDFDRNLEKKEQILHHIYPSDKYYRDPSQRPELDQMLIELETGLNFLQNFIDQGHDIFPEGLAEILLPMKFALSIGKANVSIADQETYAVQHAKISQSKESKFEVIDVFKDKLLSSKDLIREVLGIMATVDVKSLKRDHLEHHNQLKYKYEAKMGNINILLEHYTKGTVI